MVCNNLYLPIIISLNNFNFKPNPNLSVDSMKPKVVLRTSSLTETRDFNINIIAEFTKPVFDFGASTVEISGGRLTRQV